MPSKPPTPLKITDIGLEEYLNRTKDRHGGNGYPEFYKSVYVEKLSKSSVARMFNVHRSQIYRWIEIYEGEKE